MFTPFIFCMSFVPLISFLSLWLTLRNALGKFWLEQILANVKKVQTPFYGVFKYMQLIKVNPLPFPACKANDLECLRRGFRTFFFLMESGHLGMRPIDPIIVNSVAVTLPEQHVSFLLRRVNVTGAKWSKLAERRFHAQGGKSGAIFNSDLHVEAEIIMKIADRTEPHTSYITMDIQEVESNITYTWAGTNVNNEDYILIGPERIAVRNRRTPTYFLQPINNNFLEMNMIEAGLQAKTSVLDHFSNEIVTAVMHAVVDNFRMFARKIPVKYYYQYSSFI